GLAETLEVEGQDADRAGDVARIGAQALRLLQVHEQQLVEAEVRGQARIARRLVRRYLVEVARELMAPSVLAFRRLLRLEQRADLRVQVEGVHDLEPRLLLHQAPVMP